MVLEELLLCKHGMAREAANLTLSDNTTVAGLRVQVPPCAVPVRTSLQVVSKVRVAAQLLQEQLILHHLREQ